MEERSLEIGEVLRGGGRRWWRQEAVYTYFGKRFAKVYLVCLIMTLNKTLGYDTLLPSADRIFDGTLLRWRSQRHFTQKKCCHLPSAQHAASGAYAARYRFYLQLLSWSKAHSYLLLTNGWMTEWAYYMQLKCRQQLEYRLYRQCLMTDDDVRDVILFVECSSNVFSKSVPVR